MSRGPGISVGEALLLIATCLALFSPGLPRFFVSDDFVNLERNSFQTVGEALGFFATRDIDFYRPIPRLHFGIFDGVFGDRVVGWNLAGLLLHGLVSIAVLALAKSLLGPSHRRAPLWAAFFFAIHFIHVEPVLWASGVTSLYVTLFVVLSLLFFRRSRETGEPRHAALAVVCFAGALFSKETAVAFVPLLLVTQLVWPGGSSSRGETSRWPGPREALPFVILLGAYALVVTRIERGGDVSPYQIKAGFHVVKNAAFFVLGSFVPVRYFEMQELWRASLEGGGAGEFVTRVLARPALGLPLVAGSVGIALAAWKGSRDVRGGLLWILAAALPFLALPGSGERFLYLPSFGACLALGLGAERGLSVGSRVWGPRLAVGALVLLYVLGNLDRQRDWIVASRWTREIKNRWSYFRVLDESKTREFVGIPDAHRSAWVFRNGFGSMVRIYWEGRDYWREGEGEPGAVADERTGVVLYPQGKVGMMPAHLMP